MGDWKMDDLPVALASPQVYRYHWLAFWKHFSLISLLLVLSLGGFRFWFPLGLILVALALIGAVSIYLCRSWHTLAFTSDNRLIRRRGFRGRTADVISLFGTITSYQTPVLGQLLDMGGVYLGIAGPDIHIRHIANFASFYRQLAQGADRQERQFSPLPVQVIIQLPPARHARRGWPDYLFPEGPGPALNYPDAVVHEAGRDDLEY
jgi:hypothetical protein